MDAQLGDLAGNLKWKSTARKHERSGMETESETERLRLKLAGYTKPGQDLYRNILFDQLYRSLPKDPEVKVQIYNAEIAPGGYTNWHCHNGATFFVALQGVFEAHFEEGILVRAKAGDVYSEPIGKFHRGHNPHPEVPYLCIGFCLTSPDRDHVTNVVQPW
jgi:quercetin dioxygenase-like cupin family protein